MGIYKFECDNEEENVNDSPDEESFTCTECGHGLFDMISEDEESCIFSCEKCGEKYQGFNSPPN